MKAKLTVCPDCGGNGGKMGSIPHPVFGGSKTRGWVRCQKCDGTGKLPVAEGEREGSWKVRWSSASIRRAPVKPAKGDKP